MFKVLSFLPLNFVVCMLSFPGLTICGHNCLLTAEWMSASKIVCRVGQAKNDKGDIIVTTKSGGKTSHLPSLTAEQSAKPKRRESVKCLGPCHTRSSLFSP